MELCINEMMIKNGDLLSHLEACAGCGVKYMEVSKGQLIATAKESMRQVLR